MTCITSLVDMTVLVPLDWTSNLPEWETALWVALDVSDLTDYVFNPKAKPEPKKIEWAKHETWRLHRAIAVAAIHHTLKGDLNETGSGIHNLLRAKGWDARNRDPSYHFQMIRNTMVEHKARTEKVYPDSEEECDESGSVWSSSGRSSRLGNTYTSLNEGSGFYYEYDDD